MKIIYGIISKKYSPINYEALKKNGDEKNGSKNK